MGRAGGRGAGGCAVLETAGGGEVEAGAANDPAGNLRGAALHGVRGAGADLETGRQGASAHSTWEGRRSSFEILRIVRDTRLF
jgi:hypothetical protein